MTLTLRTTGAALTGFLLISSSVFAAPARPATPASKAPARPAASAVQTPEQVVQAFLKAQQDGDDDKTYALLSAAARKRYTEEQWQKQGSQVRITFAAIKMLIGDTLIVGGAANAQSKVSDVTTKGTEATVKITQTVPITNTLHLVKENGRWVIDIHRSLSVDPNPPASATQASNPPAPKPATPPAPATPPDPTNTCQNNLRQIGTAFRVYALDHSGNLPDASKWTDELQTYLSSTGLLRCPPGASDVESSYAMNSALSGMKLSEIENPEDRILLYETTTTGKNVAGTGTTQPEKAPHPGGYLVLYASGDVALLPNRPVIK